MHFVLAAVGMILWPVQKLPKCTTYNYGESSLKFITIHAPCMIFLLMILMRKLVDKL
jgi:hypothetical protein